MSRQGTYSALRHKQILLPFHQISMVLVSSSSSFVFRTPFRVSNTFLEVVVSPPSQLLFHAPVITFLDHYVSSPVSPTQLPLISQSIQISNSLQLLQLNDSIPHISPSAVQYLVLCMFLFSNLPPNPNPCNLSNFSLSHLPRFRFLEHPLISGACVSLPPPVS